MKANLALHHFRSSGFLAKQPSLCFVLLPCLLYLSVSQVSAKGLSDLTQPASASLWNDFSLLAAKETLRAVKRQTGAELTLEDVPLETLQVVIGRRHKLGLEVEGVQYEVVLGSEADVPRGASQSLPAGKRLADRLSPASGSALPPAIAAPATSLVAHDWLASADRSLELPAVSLAGPIELVLSRPSAVSVYTPHATDVGVVKRIVVAAGAAVRVSGARAIALRRPLQLPRLPTSYLAEVWAHAKLLEPEEGFQNSPGIHYLSSALQALAVNSSSDQNDVQLLSFLIEAGRGGLTVMSAQPTPPPQPLFPQTRSAEMDDVPPPPRLKVRRLKGDAVELSLRQGQVQAASPRFSLPALATPWVWPLPAVPLSQMLPYETVLRGVLAAHPVDVDKLMKKQGLELRLTKSDMSCVRLVTFDLHVRGTHPAPPHLEGTGFQHAPHPLEIWEAVVQVEESGEDGVSSVGGAEDTVSSPLLGVKFTPLSVKRRTVYGNTVTLSDDVLRLALVGNSTAPMGFESEDLGIARNAV